MRPLSPARGLAPIIVSEAASAVAAGMNPVDMRCAVDPAPSCGDRRQAMLEDIAIQNGQAISAELGSKLANMTRGISSGAGTTTGVDLSQLRVRNEQNAAEREREEIRGRWPFFACADKYRIEFMLFRERRASGSAAPKQLRRQHSFGEFDLAC
jgi:hypothetical protein